MLTRVSAIAGTHADDPDGADRRRSAPGPPRRAGVAEVDGNRSGRAITDAAARCVGLHRHDCARSCPGCGPHPALAIGTRSADPAPGTTDRRSGTLTVNANAALNARRSPIDGITNNAWSTGSSPPRPSSSARIRSPAPASPPTAADRLHLRAAAPIAGRATTRLPGRDARRTTRRSCTASSRSSGGPTPTTGPT